MEFLSAIQDDLNRVEERLRAETGSVVPLIEKVSVDFLQAGGKRIRPALLLLAHRACGGRDPAAIVYAVTMELIHSATLFHDDVVDEGTLRRGIPTPRSSKGNSIAVLIGDFLYLQAIRILLEGARDRVNRFLVRTTVEMTEGEVLQLAQRYSPDLSREAYFEIIQRKTAGLMEACCLAGADLADADPPVVEGIRKFGHRVGLAFQVIDDILDFTGASSTLGKESGSDLAEGSVTLPVIDLLEHLPEEASRDLAREIRERAVEEPEVRRRIALQLEEHGSLGRVRTLAEELVEQALEALAPLPPGEDRRRLEELARFVVRRGS